MNETAQDLRRERPTDRGDRPGPEQTPARETALADVGRRVAEWAAV